MSNTTLSLFGEWPMVKPSAGIRQTLINLIETLRCPRLQVASLCTLTRAIHTILETCLCHTKSSRMRRHGMVLLPNIFSILYVLISLQQMGRAFARPTTSIYSSSVRCASALQGLLHKSSGPINTL